MKSYLKNELHRIFTGTSFKLSLGIGLLISIVHYLFNVLKVYPCASAISESIIEGYLPSVFNQWIGTTLSTVESYLFFLIIPVLATIPFGGDFFEEIQTGFARNVLLNTKCKLRYFMVKFLVSFVSGGISVIIPLITNLALTSATIPALRPIASTNYFSIFATSMWAELYYSHPWIYTAFYLSIIFVFSGLFAQISLWIVFYVSNRIVVIFTPLIVYTLIYSFCVTIGCPEFSPLNFLPPQQIVYDISFKIILIEIILLFLVNLIMFVYKGCKNDFF